MRVKAWISVGVIATVFGLLASIGPGLEVIVNTATWIWANPVALVLLLLAVLSALALSLRLRLTQDSSGNAGEEEPAEDSSEEIELGPEHYAADKKTYEELIELLPRNKIRLLVEHDFGGSWSRGLSMPFFEYVETRNDVEHQFLNPTLEAKRRELHGAVDSLASGWAEYDVVMTGNADFYELAGSERRRDEPPWGEHYERYECRRKELSDSVNAVVKAYDNLVLEARKRVP